MTALPNPAASAEAVAGPNGILSAANVAGRVWVEHSTTDFKEMQKLARQAAGKGVDAIEAPVTTGTEMLRKGKIVMFLGGDIDVINKTRDILNVNAQKIVHCGAIGSASTIKVLQEMMTAVVDCYMGDVMCLGHAAGIPPHVLHECIRISYGNSYAWDVEAPLVYKQTYSPDFTAGMMLKDVTLAIKLAEEFNVKLEHFPEIERIYRKAIERYGPDAGSVIPVKLSEDANNISLRNSSFDNWTFDLDVDENSVTVRHYGIEADDFKPV